MGATYDTCILMVLDRRIGREDVAQRRVCGPIALSEWSRVRHRGAGRRWYGVAVLIVSAGLARA